MKCIGQSSDARVSKTLKYLITSYGWDDQKPCFDFVTLALKLG